MEKSRHARAYQCVCTIACVQGCSNQSVWCHNTVSRLAQPRCKLLASPFCTLAGNISSIWCSFSRPGIIVSPRRSYTRRSECRASVTLFIYCILTLSFPCTLLFIVLCGRSSCGVRLHPQRHRLQDRRSRHLLHRSVRSTICRSRSLTFIYMELPASSLPVDR